MCYVLCCCVLFFFILSCQIMPQSLGSLESASARNFRYTNKAAKRPATGGTWSRCWTWPELVLTSGHRWHRVWGGLDGADQADQADQADEPDEADEADDKATPRIINAANNNGFMCRPWLGSGCPKTKQRNACNVQRATCNA